MIDKKLVEDTAFLKSSSPAVVKETAAPPKLPKHLEFPSVNTFVVVY